MNAQISRLQALLERVQRNAALLARDRALGVDVVHPETAGAAPVAAADAGPAPINGSALTPVMTLDDFEIVELPETATPPPPSHRQATAWQSIPAEEEAAFDESLGSSPPPPAAAVAAQIGLEEVEVEALKGPRTPPPESGPQEMPAKATPPEEDIVLVGVADAEQLGATVEQLGATVELEPPVPGELEIQEEEPILLGVEAEEEYEESLPHRAPSALYDESLVSPPAARDDLEAHDRAEREREARVSQPPPGLSPASPSEVSPFEAAAPVAPPFEAAPYVAEAPAQTYIAEAAPYVAEAPAQTYIAEAPPYVAETPAPYVAEAAPYGAETAPAVEELPPISDLAPIAEGPAAAPIEARIVEPVFVEPAVAEPAVAAPLPIEPAEELPSIADLAPAVEPLAEFALVAEPELAPAPEPILALIPAPAPIVVRAEAVDEPTGVIERAPLAAETRVAVFHGARPETHRTFLDLLDDSLRLGPR